MRSVSSTAALRYSGYRNCFRSSSRSGQSSAGGRLSRANVSTWAEGPSAPVPFRGRVRLAPIGGWFRLAPFGGWFRLAPFGAGKEIFRDDDFLDIGSSLINPERPDFAIKRLHWVA